MSRFKAGDLALIVNCSEPSNIGKCVELIEFVPAGGDYVMRGRGWINASGIPVWVVSGDVEGVAGHGWAQKSEQNLMPLRGDFQPEGKQEGLIKSITEHCGDYRFDL